MLIGENGAPDPQFVDPANGNYELAFSPAVNTGNAAFATVGPYDARHATRVIGPAPDLGAFERGSLWAWDAEEGDLGAWAKRVPAS
jgi:hypothetical protein